MKIKINLIIDVIAFIVFTIIGFSGIIMWKVLPCGNGEGGGKSLDSNFFWGLDRFGWMDLHTYLSFLLIVLIIVHLILHRQWIKNIGKVIKN